MPCIPRDTSFTITLAPLHDSATSNERNAKR